MDGRVRSYSDDADAAGDFGVEHDEGGVEEVVDVDDLEGGAVELGVLLGRADEAGDAGDGVVDLAYEEFGFDGVGEPADGGFEVDVADAGGDVFEPGLLDAAGDEGGCEVPGAGDVVFVEPVADGVFGVGGFQCGTTGGVLGLFDGGFLEFDEVVEAFAVEAAVGDHGEFVAHAGDFVAEDGG